VEDIAWVARLYCGHDIGGRSPHVPHEGDQIRCKLCGNDMLIMAVITNEPLRDPVSRRT
jgi:hypothetical protein